MQEEITKRIRVYGIVQGVGFRPTVSRHAAACGVRGSVCNKGPYVEIYAQGTAEAVESFLENLKERPPKRAAILKLNTEQVEEAVLYPDFSIIESEKTSGEIFVSPDIAICEECKAELYAPKDRRYLHPFINCTCCGPRLTILDALPYDRERTSMKEFPMCPDCAAEYHDPETRRYDAQPVCCNECGPTVYLIGQKERGRAAITRTRQVIADGGIAAIKGIGGFHLCCDATNEDAVSRLRTLKRRPAKPFAVMARDMAAVRRECDVTKEQEEVLDGHQKPIILLRRKQAERHPVPGETDTELTVDEGAGPSARWNKGFSENRKTADTDAKRMGRHLALSVAPDNPNVGMMLPYAPVQLLLFDYDDDVEMPDLLVMTSGNTSGAPICRDDADAEAELAHLCDVMLSHDRKIRIRADDTVMDFYKKEPYMIRRSRGYAPLPFQTSMPWSGQVIAVGGELKNTFCIGVDGRFYQSPYVGDLEDLRTVKALEETIDRFQTLLEVHPSLAICDLHPKYNSTLVAEELGLPVVKVQHHYAHILSCMAENDCFDPVIGVSFDGTGYGTDGTIWGGEILLADDENFTRFGSIAPFLQIGGDASAREGWRIAASMLYSLTGDRARAARLFAELNLCSEAEGKVLCTMADRKMNAIVSTSAGRLFDAVSAILGIRRASTFEGEASTALQFAAEAFERCSNISDRKRPRSDNYESGNSGSNCFRLRTDELVREITSARLDGADVGELAWLFHRRLAELIAEACAQAREASGRNKTALSGGVFQNRLLLRMTEECLTQEGFEVLRHHMIPPNDGGLAIGQAAYGMRKLQNMKSGIPFQE